MTTVSIEENTVKPLADYSFIRGVCYSWDGDQATIERDLCYAQRLMLNSTRIWLRYSQYWQDPAAYIEKLRTYVRTAHGMGISTMPILWNGNKIDVSILDTDYRTTGEQYVNHVVDALKDEEGLLMWDIMNEPTCNDYIRKATPEQRPEHEATMWSFVRHFCTYVRETDPHNAITVGNTYVGDTEPTADLVDVISFHDYLETRQRVENTYLQAEAVSARYGKPLINSELACLCRANPYDMALEICERHHVGWYLFELMVHGYWGDVHGIVYPDGTVRDPAIVAALHGFHRNRDVGTRIRPNPNKEGRVSQALKLVEDTLTDESSLFLHRRRPTDELLEAAEYCANLLEGCEMVPMIDAPSARILAWRQQHEEERDREAIRAFTYDLARLLKKHCQIL
jgi:hypothetical protein